MGIGNFSDREAAVKIARKLEMNVIGVAMPLIDRPSGANFEIMHLDTVFNFLDRPYPELKKGEFDMPVSLKSAIEAIAKVGWITLFQAGSGEARELGQKLGDYLVAQGYEIIPARP